MDPFENDNDPLDLSENSNPTPSPSENDPPTPESVEEPAAQSSLTTSTEPTTQSAPAKAMEEWKEPQMAPVTKESNGVTILVLGIILALAAGIVFLSVQNHSLRERIDLLNSQFEESQSQMKFSESQAKLSLDQAQWRNADLQGQLDRASQTFNVGLQAATAKSDGLKIISAVYGSGQNFRDVTDRVCETLGRPDYEVYAKPEWLKTDPSPGWNKELIIIYEYRGTRRIHLAGEGGRVTVAMLASAPK